MAAEVILHMSISPDLKEALARAADLGGISQKQVVEAMLANAAGRPHRHGRAVVNVWSRFRRQGRLHDIRKDRA